MRLTNPTTEDVTFEWSTADGTATFGQDYSRVLSGTGTILAGQSQTEITVAISGDTTVEPDETFFVNVTNAIMGENTPVVIEDAQAVGTIRNDEVLVQIAPGTRSEGNEGQANMNFVVSASQVSAYDVTVTFEVIEGTAKEGEDYLLPGQFQVVIPAGLLAATIQIPILGDTTFETNETFTVKLVDAENATVATTGGSATGTIVNDDAAPAISIGNVSVLEGNSGTQVVEFTVSMSAASDLPVTVRATPISGSAVLGSDFTATAQTITFAPGETEAKFRVTIIGDTVFEPDETFTVVLSNATNATIAAGTGTGTILGDDAEPTISIKAPAPKVEGTGGNTTFTFEVELSNASSVPVTVTASTLDGTALAGSDYLARTQTLTIPAGQTKATFSVTVLADAIAEATEQFSVQLSNASGAAITTDLAVATIINDDLAALSIADKIVTEGNSGEQEVRVTVTLSTAADRDVTFKWKVAEGGTALVDSDYTIESEGEFITILAGQRTADIIFKVFGDTDIEADESFTVELSDATFSDGAPVAFSKDSASVKILNDELFLSVADATVEEGDEGEVNMVFTITLSGVSSHDVTVFYYTQDLTATSLGETADYVGIPAPGQSVVIPAGQTSVPVTVKVKGDLNYDGDDQFKLILSQPVNALIADGEAIGTITDGDDALPTISIGDNVIRAENADKVTVNGVETDAPKTLFKFTVSLDHASDDEVEVFVTTINGTAQAGTDFIGLTKHRVVFAPGEISKEVVVEVLNDDLYETDEAFTVLLSDPSGGLLGNAEATGTILADPTEPAPTLQVTSQSIVEGNNGQKFLTFVVQRIGETGSPITFNFNTVAHTGPAAATPGVDFVPLNLTGLTLEANETSRTFQVEILTDTVDELDETFGVEVVATSGAHAAPVTATGTILNDDVLVTLEQGSYTILEGDSGQSDLVFIVKLSQASTHDIVVTYTVGGGTAQPGSDYIIPTVLSLLIPNGTDTAEIRIPVLGDTVAEPTETFVVTLTGATHAELGTTDLSATGTILNDDATLAISDSQILEGANGTKMMRFTVTLEASPNLPVSVNYTTQGGTATSGTDFEAVSGTLQFAIGQTEAFIDVPIKGDTTPEQNETFNVVLSNASGATIVRDTATGTILDDDTTLSISDVTITEGNSGTKTAVFTITRSVANGFDVSVRVSTLDWTAVSTGEIPDFVEKTQVLTFTGNQLTQTFSVVILGDTAFEPDTEQFKVVLSEATNAIILKGEGTGTITNGADAPPTIRIDDASISEGNDGTKQLGFVVTLSEATGFDVSFRLSTAFSGASNAADAADFTGVNEVFTIPAGTKSYTVYVPIHGDTVDELDEVFVANLSEANIGGFINLTIAKGQAIGTILNDEISVSVVPTASGVESAGTIPVRITLSTVSSHDVLVSFKLENGTAVLGTDYTAPGAFTVTIPAGQTEAFVNVPITDDAVDENDKTFKVTLTGATNAVLGGTTSSNVTIVDDDLEPIISVADVSVIEGQNAIFTVTLAGPSAKDVTIYWVTEAGTASTSDYQHSANARTLVIPAGQTTGQISIPTTNDNVDELDETFKLRILSSLDNPTGNPGVTATATIAANDENRISISDARVVETDGETQMVFTVTRTGSNLPVSVQYSTQNGTALAGLDYVGVQNQLLEFASGETSKTISITILGDNDVELDETFFVTLSSPTNATIQTGSGRGTIADDEVQYSIQAVNSFSIVEGDGPGTKVIQLRIERLIEGTNTAPNFAGTVFYETQVNTAEGALRATAGTDYITKSGSVSFAPGETFKIIEIAIVGDNILEGDETFVVKLTNSVNGTPSATEGSRVITILDNDRLNNPAVPKVVIEDAQLVEGAAGQTTDMVFKVKLVGADGTTPMTAAGAIEITYSLSDLTAVAGGDYMALANGTATITILAGQSEALIRVPIIGDDDAAEPDETFAVNLVGAKFITPGSGDEVALQIADNQAIGTILNDDLTITLDPYEPFSEGNGEQTLNFTVRIPQAVGYDVTLRVKTVDGTAVSSGNEADYVSIDQEIIIPAGETSFTFSVLVKGDPFAEGNETFNLVFSEVKNAAFDTTPRTVTLLNDDAAPTLSISDATVIEGDNGQQNMVFNVVLSGANREQITVDFATVDGTAKSSGALLDYLARNGTLVFDPSTEGSVTKTIMVPILGDTWKEETEHFTVVLSNARLGGNTTGVTISDGTGTGEIVDNGDTTLGVILHDAQVVEGAAGANSNLIFRLETTAPVTGSDIMLLANTRAGTAKVGEDFNALTNANVTIAVGQTTGTVTVTVRGDNVFEASEFLFLDVTGFGDDVKPVNGSGGTLSAYGVILNDDLRIISAREFQYIDTDGDLVTVKFSKGTLSVPLTGAGGNSNNIFFTFSGTVGGRMIQQINLTSAGFAFEGVNISITAKPQVLVTGEILGDGKADVGSIFAASVNSDLFQVSSGIALGKVSISGNLGQLVAGSTKRPAGVKFLEVGSFGSDSTVGSLVLGPINKMVVHGDFLGNLRVIGDAAAQPIPGGGVGRIGNLVIEGALKGGNNEGSGRITFTGGIGTATIGSILGGSGVNSGTLVPAGDGFNTSIGRLTVLGDMVGGAGEQSGLVQTDRIGSLVFGKAKQGKNGTAIEGNLIGGAGKFSGLVTADRIGKVLINGSIEGGTGENSGNLLVDKSLGNTRLTGSLIGGAGRGAGLINVGVLSGNVIIEGNVEGGAGQNSGALSVNGYRIGFESFLGNAKTITIGKAGAAEGGSLIGGTGASSGRIDVNGNLNKFVAHGDIVGGKGANSGALVVGSTQANTALKTALIKGSILGGSTDAAGTPGGVTNLLGTGYIEADRIGKLTVEGSLVSGTNLGTGLAKSGGIYAGTTIGNLKVLGKGGTAVQGSASTPVVITALNKIGNVTFGGDVQYLELLSGYAAPTSTATPRGVMFDAGASIGNVIVNGKLSGSSIVAGVHAGADGKFGTADDTGATNGTGSLPGNQDLVSKIASLVIREIGVPLDAPANASFGIVAEHVAKLRIANALHPLAKGPSNDGLAAIGAPAAKMQIFEI